MYCTIAPSSSGDLLNNNARSVIPVQLGVVRVPAKTEPPVTEQCLSFSRVAINTQLCAQASYAVLGGSCCNSTLPNYSSSYPETVHGQVERRTRADRNPHRKADINIYLNHNTADSSSAPPSMMPTYHSSASSGGNASPVPFSSLPDHETKSSQSSSERSDGDFSSGDTRWSMKQASTNENICRPSCRHKSSKASHNAKAACTGHGKSQTLNSQSQFLNWKNGRAVQQCDHRRHENVQSKIFKYERTINELQHKRSSNKHQAMDIDHSQAHKCGRNSSNYKPEVPPRDDKIVSRHHSSKKPQRCMISTSKLCGNYQCDFSDGSKVIYNAVSSGKAENLQKKLPTLYTTTKVQKKTETKSEESNKKKSFLDMYEVFGVIGVGGGGMVYSGIRTTDKQPVAIKRIMREKVKRWEKIHGRTVPQEIALMIRVNGHRGIIRLLDWYECLDSFILILERPKNSIDLFDYIREVGRMTEKEACMIFTQIVYAVYHIHSRGVVHRDIKDENIVLNRDTGESKLIDFGCGTLLHEHHYRDFSGTPEFYPPEWFNEHYYTARTAATWSLGVLLFDMLCGEIPFKTKQKIALGKFEIKAPLSSEAKHLISWMLSMKPESRPSLIDILQHPWLSGRCKPSSTQSR